MHGPRKTSAPRVAVFDSGVGGLSILESILVAMPGLDIVFCTDSAAYPYGTKTEEFVDERVSLVVRALCQQTQPDLVVVACNTASTVALPRLRSELSVPVVGVVPAIKTANGLSRTRAIGLLATPATVRRPYTDRLIQEFAADCQVIKVGSAKLVDLAEEWIVGTEPDLHIIQRELAPFFSPSLPVPVDAIVLGCTHFPLLRQHLALASPRPVQWVDSGEAIARRSAHVLREVGFADATWQSNAGPQRRQAYMTGGHAAHPLSGALVHRGFAVATLDV